MLILLSLGVDFAKIRYLERDRLCFFRGVRSALLLLDFRSLVETGRKIKENSSFLTSFLFIYRNLTKLEIRTTDIMVDQWSFSALMFLSMRLCSFHKLIVLN